jgi:hypothetical protein
MSSTVRELVDRIEGFTIGNFAITDLRKHEDGSWFVRAEITADLKGLEAYEFCKCLNGWDKTDYFSVLSIEVSTEDRCIEATVLRKIDKSEVEE